MSVKVKRKRRKKVKGSHISMFHPHPINRLSIILADDIVELREGVFIKVIAFDKDEFEFEGEFLLDLKEDSRDNEYKYKEIIMNKALDALNHVEDCSKNAMKQMIAHIDYMFPTPEEILKDNNIKRR